MCFHGQLCLTSRNTLLAHVACGTPLQSISPTTITLAGMSSYLKANRYAPLHVVEDDSNPPLDVRLDISVVEEGPSIPKKASKRETTSNPNIGSALAGNLRESHVHARPDLTTEADQNIVEEMKEPSVSSSLLQIHKPSINEVGRLLAPYLYRV